MQMRDDYGGNDTDAATSTPKKLSVTLRPCRASRSGQVGVDFEQMTKESYAKRQLKDNNEGSDTETEGEEK